MKKLIILFLFVSSALFAQVNLKYINVIDSLEIREQGTSLQFFQFDATNGITFPDGTTQATSGVGALLTGERLRVDTISGNNNTEILFLDPIVVESVAADTFKTINGEGILRESPGGGFELVHQSSGDNIAFNDGQPGITVTSTSGRDIALTSGDDIFLQSSDILQLWSTNGVITIGSDNDYTNISSNGSSYRFTGDTLFLDGTNGSTANNIKPKNLYATNNVEADSGIFDNITSSSQTLDGVTTDTNYSFDYAMENTVVDYLQFSTDTSISTHVEGRISYDSARKQLILDDDISGKWNISAEVGDRFFNPTGAQIDNGKIVRITGDTIFNGYHYSKVELAGISSDDSILVLGAATTNLPSVGFGRVTFLGRLNDLNTTGITGLTYLGFEGNRIDTSPPPPYYSVCIGQTPYEDNDSGYMYFAPQMPQYNPTPHFQTDTSDLNQDVSIVSANIYEYIPIGSGRIYDNYGFIVAGDSLQARVSGHYTFVVSLSFEGNPTSETWNYGIFINGVLQHKKTRTTASSSAGDANVPISRELNAGDWFSTKIRNTTGTGDPTIVDLSVELIFLHVDQ